MTSQNTSFDESGQFAWDATSLKNWYKCPRYYQYTNLEGWSSPHLSVHLKFGQVYADALEHYYKHIANGESPEKALSLVVHQALIDTWVYPEEDYCPETNPGKPWDSLHNAKTRETLIRSIVWYFAHFEDDPMPTVTLANGKPAVELSFRLPVNDDIILCGHMDRIVEYTGGNYVMDQKTTGGAIGSYFFDGFNPDEQMSMYTYAGNIVFGLPIKGVIIDAAKINVGFTDFGRGFTHRSKGSLEEWYDQTMYTIETARHHTKENYFPMNTQSCGNYGGCSFRKICQLSPESRPNFLKGNFVQRPRWDPLKPRT